MSGLRMENCNTVNKPWHCPKRVVQLRGDLAYGSGNAPYFFMLNIDED